MSEWKTVVQKPSRPMMVLYYSATMELHDSTGKKLSPKITPYRDEAYALGFFDGEAFCYIGTGHELFEWDHDVTDPRKPTHWMPLPKPPKTNTP